MSSIFRLWSRYKSPILLSQCPLDIAPQSSTHHEPEPGAGLRAPHLRRGDALLSASVAQCGAEPEQRTVCQGVSIRVSDNVCHDRVFYRSLQVHPEDE